jgi:hypothetical protein
MEILNKTYDRACCEVEDILNRQSLSKQDVELWGALVDIIKDVEMIYDYQDKMDGYSQMNGSSYMNERSGRMMPTYNYGSHRRDSNGYSRSDNREMVLNHLQNVADMAMDEKDKKAVSRLISQMESQQN